MTIEERLTTLEMFYLAKRILGCKNCRGIVIFDWEIPNIMLEISRGKLCPKHAREFAELEKCLM